MVLEPRRRLPPHGGLLLQRRARHPARLRLRPVRGEPQGRARPGPGGAAPGRRRGRLHVDARAELPLAVGAALRGEPAGVLPAGVVPPAEALPGGAAAERQPGAGDGRAGAGEVREVRGPEHDTGPGAGKGGAELGEADGGSERGVREGGQGEEGEAMEDGRRCAVVDCERVDERGEVCPRKDMCSHKATSGDSKRDGWGAAPGLLSSCTIHIAFDQPL